MSVFYPSWVERSSGQRLIILGLFSGIISVLCQAAAFTSFDILSSRLDSPFEIKYPILADSPSITESSKAFQPTALDDYTSTVEESPVTLNVLVNDREKDEDDDEGDAIDASTVDIEPGTPGIDSTLTNSAGTYSVNNAGDVTYLPAVNYTGTSIIRYTVSDVTGKKSNSASVFFTVTNLNDVPTITGQSPSPLTTGEDQPIAITFSHLLVTDPDDNYPSDFTLAVSPGTNYTVSGTTVTPAAEYSGTLTVPVTVNDGEATSNIFDLQIAVSAVNDVPVITSQTPNPVTTGEDQPVVIALGNLTVTDPDNSYPSGFTLQVGAGANYSVSGTTVMPAANFAGALSVPVTVSDGAATSAPFSLQLSVTGVNDAPSITGQVPDPLTTGEEQPITVVFNQLLVTDPDDVYPEGFTMTLSPDMNYTVSGTTVTPAADFAGTLSVPATVNDGEATSNSFTLTISVTGANDVPIITGQSPLATSEDTPITISLAHLQVTDSDNSYPNGFSLTVSPGDGYSVSGSVVTPALNYSGTLTVPVTVSDGSSNSSPFNLAITVNAVNDGPQILSQVPLNTLEGQPIALDLSQLSVSDPDNSYPSGFTLSILAGSNYTVSGNVITPAAGFNGALTVGIFVNDGAANSPLFNLQITVNPVNDPPVITGQIALSVAEDNPLTLQLSDLKVSDSDNTYPAGFVLKINAGMNYTFSGATITPAANFAGTLSVSVVVNDGVDDSAPFALQVTVTPVNDAPLITGQEILSANEDQAIALELSHFFATDPDNSYPTGFTLVAFAGLNYTVSGDVVTPSANFQGTLSVPVQVNDGALNSNIFSTQITINGVNDAPLVIGQTPLSTPEDTPVTILPSHLSVIDSDNVYPSGFTVIVAAGTNYTVSGTTVTPASDFTGTLNVNLTVSDGTNSSALFVFQIQVGDANDPPVITGQSSVSANEEQAFTILLSHLTVSDPDNPYPTGFSLLVSPGENFTVNGTTITPALNYAGTLIIPVRVNDGVNNSSTFNFNLQVSQINDAPSFDAIANIKIPENSPPGSVTITNISKGPGENDQQLTFVATSGNTAIISNPVVSFSALPTTATLSYTTVPNTSGLVTISVVVIDSGPAAAPHQNTYSASFQIEVTEINSAPTLSAIGNVVVQEDAPLQSITLQGITAGAGENQPLSLTVLADKPELFEIFEVGYISPEASGTLRIKPAANVNGSANITVMVADNGSSVSPSVNSISRVFTLTIQALNDPPVFLSAPVTLAVVNEPYEYIIEIEDIENKKLPFSAFVRPPWSALTAIGDGKAKLTGTPPVGSTGTTQVRILVTDGEVIVEQQFSLIVNTRPAVTSFLISVNEDKSFAFQSSQFTASFSDADQQPMASVILSEEPAFGKLFLSALEIRAGDTIAVSSLSSLVYTPNEDYSGGDIFYWKGSDGYHFSKTEASVEIQVLPVNDPPRITLETDTLNYEVNGEAAFVSTLLRITDPDDDSLTQAEIAFNAQQHHPEFDRLGFQNKGNIRGLYDFQTGRLSLNGKAPLAEYENALKSVQYTHLNTLDPSLGMKRISYNLTDGKEWSEPADRLMILRYTFIELDIPSGFTPNGDQANDTWVISRPGGLEQLGSAVIKVFNKRGVLVYKAIGFGKPWDGTKNGEILPADSYFFTIDLKLKSKKTYKGIVTILR